MWLSVCLRCRPPLTALVVALALAALPTPPTQVKYVCDKGDVTFDHAAHVSRREPCLTCHGEGPARKIALGKRKAHVVCVGCHAGKRAGPKGCDGCHV